MSNVLRYTINDSQFSIPNEGNTKPRWDCNSRSHGIYPLEGYDNNSGLEPKKT